MGNISMVPITTDSIALGFIVEDAVTADDHAISFTLQTRVRLNPANGYQHLATFVAKHGRSFAEDLIQELDTGLDGWARGQIGQYEHATLRRISVRRGLNVELPLAFGEGVLTVVGFTVENTTWSAKALQLEQEEQDRAVRLAQVNNDAAVAQVSATLTARLGLHKLREFEALAAATNRPVEWLAFPEQEQLSRAAAHDIVMKLLEPGNRNLWNRDPSMLTGLFAAAGVTMPSQTGPALTRGSATPQARQIERNELTEVIVEPSDQDDLPQMKLHRRLLRGWRRTHDVDPVALAGARKAADATVIAVSFDGPASAQSSDYDHVYDDLPVTVLSLKLDTLDGVVNQWLQTVGENVDLSAQVDRAVDGTVTVRVQGPASQARSVVRRLNEPSSSATAALEELLEGDEVRIVLGTA